MAHDPFVYITYIRSTPEKVWEALTSSAFTKRYWSGVVVETDWKVGSPVRFTRGGKLMDSGEVLVADRPRTLSYTFKVEWNDDLRHFPPARVTFEIEEVEGAVRLSLTHDRLESEVVRMGIAHGWPMVLASLKSLLETGEALAGLGSDPKIHEEMERIAKEARRA
jgi:uncharacterized protein YndB with AHSA1/START domain